MGSYKVKKGVKKKLKKEKIFKKSKIIAAFQLQARISKKLFLYDQKSFSRPRR
jgi:hypothetical protein